MNVLIVYGTTDGMTRRIAERIADTARDAGHRATIVDAAVGAPVDPGAHDAVFVGASLHAGGFQRSIRRFVRAHLHALRRRPSAFFSVCLAIASKLPGEREAALRIATRFPADLGWSPDRVEVFAGALMFSRYGFLRRTAMTHIARKQLGGAIDTTKDHIYTDWDAVERFARTFLAASAVDRGAGVATASP